MQIFNSLHDSFNMCRKFSFWQIFALDDIFNTAYKIKIAHMYGKLSFWQIFALDDILNTAYEIKIVLFQYTYTYHFSFHTISI